MLGLMKFDGILLNIYLYPSDIQNSQNSYIS